MHESKTLLTPNFPRKLAYAIYDHCRNNDIPVSTFINRSFTIREKWLWMQEPDYISKLVKNVLDSKEVYYERDMIPFVILKESATAASNIGIYHKQYRNRIFWLCCALALDQYNCDNPNWNSFTKE